MAHIRRLKGTLKAFLEEMGFTVELDRALQGYSGIEHSFDIVATRDGKVLCFDFANLSEDSLIRAVLKAIDVNCTKVFLMSKTSCTDNLPDSLGDLKVLEVVLFEDAEDLLRKISSVVAEASPLIRN